MNGPMHLHPSLRFAASFIALAALITLVCVRPAASISVASAAAAPGPNDVAVVVHPGVPVSGLSTADLRKILLGEQQYWRPTNQRITLLILAPEARERGVLLKRVYQFTEAQFRQYWIAKVFRADVASGPKIVTSSQSATQLTAGIPGAITFVSADQVPRGLKILKIDGRLPGEPGYALQ